MYNSAKKTHYSDALLRSLVDRCALLSVLTRNRYTISLDLNPFMRLDSHYHRRPPSTILSFLKQSKLDAA